MKNSRKLLIFVLFFCIYLRFISGFSLDNHLLPGGVDTAAHMHKVWYVTEFGIHEWDYYWLGGTPFLRFYPPLLPFLGGMLGKIFGFLLAYKLMNNIFFALTPLVFFYFIKEFKLSDEKMIIAILFFSFMPVYSYFQSDGRWSSIINLFFCLIYWIFLKRGIDGDRKYLVLSGIVLSICILSQLTTTAFLIPITLFWVLTYRRKIDVIYKLLSIFSLTLILTSFWSIQFLINTWTLSKETGISYAGVFKQSKITKISQDLITEVMLSIELYSKNNIPTILFIAASFVFSFLSLFKIKDKTAREFIIITAIICFMIFFVRFKRSFIFLPIPMSIIIAEGISIFGKRLKIFSFSLLLILLLISFFSIKSNLYPFPEYPKIPKDGRVLFLPFSTEFPNLYKYSIVLAPVNGNENIFEWGWITQETNYIVVYSNEKNYYSDSLANPERFSKYDYYALLKEGYVNYIFVNKDYENTTKYFIDNNFVKKIDETKTNIIFEIVPKSTYIEINNISIYSKIEKKIDEIIIQTNCTPGGLVIKETYDPFWKGTINNKPLKLIQNEFSFMKTDINENGPCEVRLKFEDPKYYFITNFVSILGFAIITVYLIFSYSIFRLHKKKYHK